MLVARCHIPGCEDTAGRRGFMCPPHWALVPKALQLRHQAAYRGWKRQASWAKPWDTGADCIRHALLLLWSHAFPVPPGCTSRDDCPCQLCAQSRAVATVAFERRRYVDTRLANAR